jgi:hypothetical protein
VLCIFFDFIVHTELMSLSDDVSNFWAEMQAYMDSAADEGVDGYASMTSKRKHSGNSRGGMAQEKRQKRDQGVDQCDGTPGFQAGRLVLVHTCAPLLTLIDCMRLIQC